MRCVAPHLPELFEGIIIIDGIGVRVGGCINHYQEPIDTRRLFGGRLRLSELPRRRLTCSCCITRAIMTAAEMANHCMLGILALSGDVSSRCILHGGQLELKCYRYACTI